MGQRCLGCMEIFGSEFQICPHCGYVVGTNAEEATHMEPGTLLYDRYIIGKVLGYGGFGVTYLCWDGKLEQKVAIKEYMPSEFSTRMPGQSQITVFYGDKQKQFKDGLHKFVDEAKRLAKFQNEDGIVRVFDAFEENDTAYIVMEYLDGETLTSYLKRVGRVPEEDAVAMLTPVMESLKTIHAEGMIHRDIAPDNIFLTKSGEVKLIDFGASRYATTSHSRSLTVIVKPGYSPEEQYRSRSDQGPYTDVYSLAATMYKMITGKTPPDAMERRAKYENQNRDILEEPHKLEKSISRNREVAILNAMNVRIEDRSQDISIFMQELSADPPAKRRYGKIKKIDIYSWPLWAKICVPVVLSLVLSFGALLVTGVIDFSKFTEEIIIPDGIVVAPDVEGLQQKEAIEEIKSAQLLVTTGKPITSEYIPAGTIILQNPVGGSYLDINGTVELIVSSGGENVETPVDGIATVPHVEWAAKEDAIAKLKEAGLGEPIIEESHSNDVAYGSVISQSIAAGEKIAERSVITLVISLGAESFDIPDVAGKKLTDAKKLLESKGLVVNVSYEKNDTVSEGNVIRQSVEAGTAVKQGDEVTIFISSGLDTIEVSSVVGMTKEKAIETLETQGFKVTVLENYDTNVKKGNVIGQSPEGGTSQLKDAEIIVYVSKGKKPLKVVFDANGGKTGEDEKTIHYEDVYGELPIPTRKGYTFKGWYSSKEEGVEVTSSTNVTTPSNHTVYARWEANLYKVTLDGNGVDNPASIMVEYEKTYAQLPILNRDGYAFKGWYTSKKGGERIDRDITVTITNDTILYAQWEAGAMTVMLEANGGICAVSSLALKYDGTYRGLKEATKVGYTFDGWYTDAKGGKKITSDSKVLESVDHTLYAHWKKNEYKIHYDANGGTGSMSDSVHTYDDGKELPDNKFTRKGYSFLGWSTEADSISAKYMNKQLVKNLTSTSGETITLYAVWGANSYSIHYDANGGTGKMDASYLTFDAEKQLATNEFKKDGYTFMGWSLKSNASDAVYSNGQNVKNLAEESDAIITLYAVWKPNSYVVKYDANGGRGSMDTSNHTYDTENLLSNNAFEREGYQFEGWSTSSNATSTTYTDSQSIKNLSSDDGDTITLYAVWKVNSYTIRYDANGGSGTTNNSEHTYDTAKGLTNNGFSKVGYTFVGWGTSSSATQATYTNGQSVKNLTSKNKDTITLYALWKANTYTIQYNANGGSGSMGASSYTYNEAKALAGNNFKRTGYSFLGWSTSSSATQATYSNGQSVKNLASNNGSTVTLYAVWKENAWTDWTSSLPAGVSSDKYEIVTEVRYQYRDKSTKESTSSKLDGWTQYSSYVKYSDWVTSSWTSNYYKDSETCVKVEEKTVTDQAEYWVRHMFTYKIGNQYYFYNKSGSEYYEIWTTNFEADFAWNQTIYGPGNVTMLNYAEDGEAYTYNPGWHNGKNVSGWLFFIKKGGVTHYPAVTHQEYKYKTRTATTMYQFYKWSSWTETKNKVTASSTREVKQVTYYKYRLK